MMMFPPRLVTVCDDDGSGKVSDFTGAAKLVSYGPTFQFMDAEQAGESPLAERPLERWVGRYAAVELAHCPNVFFWCPRA